MGLHVLCNSSNYCVTIWGSTYPTNLDRLILLQKKVIRVLGNEDFYAHSSPIFKSLKILKFQDIYFLNLGKFMFSYTHNLLPEGFNNFFSPTDKTHSYNLRSSSLFYLPFCRTKIRQFTVYYQGPKFFNSLRYDIRSASTIESFQAKLKEFLFASY